MCISKNTNIVHLSTSDKRGGAAIAARRLNEAFVRCGYKSKMLVMSKQTTSPHIQQIKVSKFRKIYTTIRSLTYDALKEKYLRSTYEIGCNSFTNILHLPEVRDAEIIYIHWVQGGFLSISQIKKIIETGKQVRLVMHDMWMITGGCYSALDCKCWLEGCPVCDSLRYFKTISGKKIHSKMLALSGKSNLLVITPSEWLTSLSKKSSVLKNVQIVTIPNAINCDIFMPISKEKARQMYSLPEDKTLLMFGAAGGTNNTLKGWKYFCKLLCMYDPKKVEAVVLGNYIEKDPIIKGYNIHSMGYLGDEVSLAVLYNAVDVFISPTLAESFGLTLVEAISCGTPSVAFSVGGTPDTIVHLDTGYLAKLKDVKDLKNGIDWALAKKMTEKERLHLHSIAVDKFSYQAIVHKHVTY